MMARARLTALMSAILWCALPLSAGWFEVWQQEMTFDLGAGREHALAVISSDPSSADAVAAATWWLSNMDDLPAPDEVLAAAPSVRDPELGFVLGRIAGRLRTAAPPGVLTVAEIAGPFGVFSLLDLERDVVPPDASLPPLGTRWRDPAAPFRLRMKTLDGRHGPPLSMITDGVYLAAWNLESAADAVGWLVVEAEGGYNLELDGRVIDRRRQCGVVDAGINWYRLRLGAGTHRLRIEIASMNRPRVSVSLLDDQGRPLEGVGIVDEPASSWAASQAESSLPPASSELSQRLAGDSASLSDLLLAAQLARGRADPEQEYRWIVRARELDPTNPWAALSMAHKLFAGNGNALGVESTRRITQLLREASAIPGAQFLDRALAVREGRAEDAERLLDSMVQAHGEDVRVLRVWVRESVRRDWAREAEDGLNRLATSLPGSLGITGLRLEVLESLERWRERDQLLRALAAESPIELRWIGEMASSCLVGEAIAATEAMVGEIDDPDFHIQLVRLHMENGDSESARTELQAARDRWGDLPVYDEMSLLLAGGDSETLGAALADVLDRDPSNLQLLALSWRRGDEPFYEPFVIDGRKFSREHRDLGAEADTVLLLDQAVERIFPDGSSLYYYHGVSRANTPQGARRASVLQPLPDAHLINVRIFKPDGRVVVPADFQLGDGAITLSDVHTGDVVEEEYVARVAATGASRRGHLPPYIYRFADPDRAFGLSEYILLVPPEVDIQVDGNFVGLEQSEEEWNGLRMLSWRAEEVPPMPTEPFAPPAQELMPWLNYGFGVTWQDVGDVIRDRVLPVLRSSPELRQWGEAALVGDGAEEQLASLMTALVDEVEAGGGELAIGVAAAESFDRRRGNRMGIVAAVLAEAGWRVDLVLTRPQSERGRRLDVPTLDAFPVALLRAQHDGEEVWIDVREERRGVNHFNPLFQGSDGLVLPLTEAHEAVSLLETLPSFPNPELQESLTLRARVSSNGDAMVNFRMPLRSGQATRLLERIESVPNDQVAMVYRQLASNLFPGADDVSGEIERSEAGETLVLDLTIPEACEPEGAGLVCRSLVLANPMVPVLASLPERTYPLVMRVPIDRLLELELVPPSGWQVDESPPRQLAAQWGSIDETLDRAGGAYRSALRIKLPAQTVEPDEYPTFARFCHAADELSSRPPRLVRSVN